MKTLDEVRKAKDELRKHYKNEPWFRGVGIIPSPDGFSLRLNIDPSIVVDVTDIQELNGIPIEIGYIRAFKPRPGK